MTKKYISILGLGLLMLISLSGCSQVGSKSANMSAIYLVTSILSLILLLGYCFLVKKKEKWFLVLFSAVTVVNVGYLSLSLSNTLEEALLSNRISYLGSVFLPVSMLMTILKNCNIKLKKWMTCILLGISVVVFLIAASPGYLDIYYKEVTLVTVGGSSALEKVYGPLHSVYLYYLVLHFTAMIATVIFARITKRIRSSTYALMILSAVIINIGVWLMEQLVDIDFEILSVSYIATELFLLGISFMIQEHSIINSLVISQQSKNSEIAEVAEAAVDKSDNKSDKTAHSDELREQYEYLSSRLYTLTPTEADIYNMYLEGSRTKDIMATLQITENTVKYHNRNIYSKLGVSSRKQLLEVVNSINTNK